MDKSANYKNELYRILWQCANNITITKRKSGTDCWIHNNSASHDYVWIKTRDSEYFPGRNNTSLHRLMFAVYNDKILTEADIIMHVCDNKKCINPKHLKLGTINDNNQDRARKLRLKKANK